VTEGNVRLPPPSTMRLSPSISVTCANSIVSPLTITVTLMIVVNRPSRMVPPLVWLSSAAGVPKPISAPMKLTRDDTSISLPVPSDSIKTLSGFAEMEVRIGSRVCPPSVASIVNVL
jgi:hypothetical protein